jgi:hypothetical protein
MTSWASTKQTPAATIEAAAKMRIGFFNGCSLPGRSFAELSL